MLPINKILCPTDFSEPSYVGLEAANELAEQFSAQLIVAHVVSPIQYPPYPEAGVGFDLAEYLEDMVNAARESLGEVARNRISPNIVARTVVLQGTPSDQIIQTAESEKADLIVIATHGWTGWRRFIFGSVAERVTRFASCPVLTVPAPPEEEKKDE